MDQYNDAVQYPSTAFLDAELKTARIRTNGMGLPVALGGGFALTYRAQVGARDVAIRCFHKESADLEGRYRQIAEKLRAAGNRYFVEFEYLAKGIRINGAEFPVVKMGWAKGEMLGTFLENAHSDRQKIETLRTQFAALERFLSNNGIAHGDLQNGNVLVGGDIMLIDYDGVWVAGMTQGRGTELGHRHFQHPKRSPADFGPEMDRFSFICIDLSLRAVANNPALFSLFSNGENIIFSANDFLQPHASKVFSALKAMPALANHADNFANVCLASPKSVPRLEEFLQGRNIPAAPPIVRPSVPTPAARATPTYVGAYDVVDATDFEGLAGQIGNKVELIGRIVNVYHGRTRRLREPYVFVFFQEGNKAIRLNIWPDTLAKLAQPPSADWTGKWLSVQGLVDPIFNGSYGEAASITVESASQLRWITEIEARYRLRSVAAVRPGRGNQNVLRTIGIASAAPQTKNQAILSSVGPSSSGSAAPRAAAPTATPANRKEPPWGWIIAGALFLLWVLLANRG